MSSESQEREQPRIIDCHGHVNWREYHADRFVENMDAHGIDVTWLLTWETTREEAGERAKRFFTPNRMGIPLEDALIAAAKYPDRFIPFFAPDPRRQDSMQRLSEAVENCGVRGCGELKVWIYLDDPRAIELFQYCGEKHLPVTFHMGIQKPDTDPTAPAKTYCCGWENLSRTLETCRDTIFLAHAPGFWREISGDASSRMETYPTGEIVEGGKVWEFLDTYPNLYCDLSARSALGAISRDPSVGKEFLIKYQDRCLFGRDCFDESLMEFLRSIDLHQQVMEKIIIGNAMKLVPL